EGPTGTTTRVRIGSDVRPPVTLPPGGAAGNVRIAQQVVDKTQAQQRRSLLTVSALALGIMALGSVLLGWLMAGRALRPVRTMTAAARQISEENLHERLALPRPNDELKELGDTIDGLLARLQ